VNLSDYFHIADTDSPAYLGGVKPRFVAIAFLVLLAIVGKLLKNYDFSFPAVLALLLSTIAVNLLIMLWIGRGKGLQYIPYFAISIDIVLITLGIHYLGGIESPISWIYAVCIMTVALVHGFWLSIYAAVLCVLLYSAVLFAESEGIIQRVSFGIVNPDYLTANKVYLYVKLICDNSFFLVTALISGLISEQLIRSRKTLEGQNKQLAREIGERKRIEGELQKYHEELEGVVDERTSALTDSVDRLQREIAEREQMEMKLRESEEKYRLHFENVGDVIFSIDREFRITSISPAVRDFLGYAPETLTGRSFPELNILAEEYFNQATADIVRVLGGERISSVEYEFIAKDGKRKLAAVSGAPLYRDGQIVGMVSVARDITDHKELERQLFQAQKMESVGTLAGGIAHDFNNLLGGVLGYASLMKEKLPENDHFFRYVSAIERSACRASELTSQLLAFSRGGKYETRAVNVNTIIKETLEIIERAFEKSIEIETCFSGQLPTVVADTAQLEQVMMNLCINARDAMPDGGKLIIETDLAHITDNYVKTHLGAQPGTYVAISITDTGTGMDKDILEKVFEPFFTTKERGKGTGLGLAMVYGVVKNHGGSVQVYSEVGEGTTFKIYLPADGRPEAEQVVRWESPYNGKGTILVVDDEESIRSLARDMLETHGYQTLLADGGEEALEIYRAHGASIDLVILDMVMPKMGGLQTFLQLKKLNPKIKAILSSGYSQNGKAQEILNQGARGFLQKPYQVSALLAKVRGVLDARI
jgi:PAS domain S-box-containing protein